LGLDVSKNLPFYCAIERDLDVFELVVIARQLAQEIGFSQHASCSIALAISEIATNVIRYAGTGTVLIQRTNNHKGIFILIEDSGPGMANINHSMKDGISSRENSLGLGFGAAQRAVDELVVNKSDNTGTSIKLLKYLPLRVEELDIGQVSFPKVGESVNQDSVLIKGYEGNKVLVAIFDFGRCSRECEQIITLLKNILEDNYKKSVSDIATLFYKELKQNSCRINVGCSILKVSPESTEIMSMGSAGVYLNTSSDELNKGFERLVETDAIYNITQTQFSTPDEYLYILYSDGVKGNRFDTSYLCDFSAQSIAMTVFDAHALSQDDASVIVIKGMKSNEAAQFNH